MSKKQFETVQFTQQQIMVLDLGCMRRLSIHVRWVMDPELDPREGHLDAAVHVMAHAGH